MAPLFGGGSGGDGEPVKKYFTKVGNVCLQMSYSYGGVGENIIGNENCLYLNVHTTAYGTNEKPPPPPPPPISSRSYKMHRTRNKRSHSPQQQKYETLLPVVLWIHGGSFNLGSSTSDTNGPDYLVEKVGIYDATSDAATTLHLIDTSTHSIPYIEILLYNNLDLFSYTIYHHCIYF